MTHVLEQQCCSTNGDCCTTAQPQKQQCCSTNDPAMYPFLCNSDQQQQQQQQHFNNSNGWMLVPMNNNFTMQPHSPMASAPFMYQQCQQQEHVVATEQVPLLIGGEHKIKDEEELHCCDTKNDKSTTTTTKIPKPSCPSICCGVWVVACMVACPLSIGAWIYTALNTTPLLSVCSWWLWCMVVELAMCFVYPIILIIICCCGGLLMARKRSKQTLRNIPGTAGAFEITCALVFVISFVAVIGTACFVLYETTGQSIPTHVECLTDEVTIEYDPSGIPHISASNTHDAYVAMGMVHARHRLWQMEFQRRAAAGTLSEILGSASIEADMQIRNLGLYQQAQRTYNGLSSDTRDSLQAYADGVNAYLDTDPHLPLEFLFLGCKPAPWTPVDSIGWVKVIGFQLSTDVDAMLVRWHFLTEYNIDYERVMQLYPQYNRSWEITSLSIDEILKSAPHVGVVKPSSKHEDPAIVAALNRLRAWKDETHTPNVGVDPYDFLPLRHGPSNNFVVSGKLTGGLPLLANDPHLRLSSPGVWYGVHLNIRGVTNAIGVSFPGLPAIVIGRTACISWGVTTTAVDVQDLYMLETTPDDTGYYYDGVVMPFVTREEVIPVKGEDPYTFTVRLTQDGMPVLSTPYASPTGRPMLALKWPLIDPVVNDTTIECFIDLMFAHNWNEFKGALRKFVGPIHNFVFASVDGDIGYYMPGLIPQRPVGVTGLWPVPGNTSAYRWDDYIPFDLLPQTHNPEKGYIVTANNQIVPEGYEHPGWILEGEYLMHYRAQRISDLIDEHVAAGRNITVTDMQEIQLDVLSYQFLDLVPVLKALPEEHLSDLASEWRTKLVAWNGDAVVGCTEATVYAAWVLELQRLDATETGYNQWGDWSTAWLHVRAVFLGIEHDPGCGGSCIVYAANALNTAVERISPTKRWGVDVHRAHFLHYVMSELPEFLSCMFDRSTEHGGDGNTVNTGVVNDSEEMEMFMGPSYRHVVSMDNADVLSGFNIPPGQSGQPLDEHYSDMLTGYTDGTYEPMTMSGYEVDETLHINP